MAPIKITGVVSCSTEDKVSCAKHLLLSDSFKKWSTEKPGVANASVILQLESEQLITGIDIGNNGSAFVEVLVANSANDSAFENLIVMSSFMTPTESRCQTNKFKIRMFGKEELCKQTADKKWDRIKIVCTQPYNKNTTYGLSVVTVQGVNKPLPKVADTPLKVMEPVGKPTVSSNTANSPVVKKQRVLETVGSKEGKAASELLSKLQQNKSSNSKEALDRLKESGDKGFKRVPGQSQVLDIRDDHEEDNKPSSSNKVKTPPPTLPPGTPKRDFSQVLSDVVFVLSGFQNPLRSDIREIGLSMGGQYRPDWCSEATHLICAIPNTPKFNQVKGRGIIVSKEWLFDCKKEKKRVLERRYRLDKPSKSSSEDEKSDKEDDGSIIVSKQSESSPIKRKHSKKIQYAESSDSDDETVPSKKRKKNDESDDEFVPTQIISSSDDEEEAAEVEEPTDKLEEPKKPSSKPLLEISSDEDVPLNPVSRPPLPDISDSESETDETPVYEADTDEETETGVIQRLGLPPLPDFFTGHRFFIHSDSFGDAEDLRQMYRYLVAYGGKVYDHMSPHVMFIVTKSDRWLSDFKQALLVNSQIKFLQSSWVEASSDQLKAVSKTSYYINQ